MKKTIKLKAIVFGVFTLCLLATACIQDKSSSYTSAATCNSTPTYTYDVKAIVDAKCASAGCHSASSAMKGVKTDNYANTKTAFQTQNSYCSIHKGSGCDAMPRGTTLTNDQINTLDCWGKNGYKE